MRLTSYTDYALRTLIFLATHRGGLVTIQDIADFHGIAKNHLTKVVHQLGQLGVVDTIRGRSGGLRLGRDPGEILIGDIVRATETDFFMAECFDGANSKCAFTPSCALKDVLNEATLAYLKVLDGVTLASVIRRPATDAVRQDYVRLPRLPEDAA